jgi:hypothetical protein
MKYGSMGVWEYGSMGVWEYGGVLNELDLDKFICNGDDRIYFRG